MESNHIVEIINWGSREQVYDLDLPEMGLRRVNNSIVWRKEYISSKYHVVDKQKFLLAVMQHGIEFKVMEKCV